MEVSLSTRIALALVVAIAAVMLAMMAAVAVTMVSADPALANHGGLHRSQPSTPPGNPDSGIITGKNNRVDHGNPGGPTDVGPLQVLVSPSLIQQA